MMQHKENLVMIRSFRKAKVKDIGKFDIMGDINIEIKGFSALNKAKTNDMVFCDKNHRLSETKSNIVVCNKDKISERNNKTLIITQTPKNTFAEILNKMIPENKYGVTIGASPNIHNSVIIENCQINDDVIIKPYAVIGGDGFAISGNKKIPHFGGVRINNNVSIGSCTCIDRGFIDDTVVGKNTHIDNLVHIAHNVEIGENCIVVAQTIIGGNVKIGDNCYVAMGAVIRDNINIGDNAFIGMGSVVTKDINAGITVIGNPARPYGRTK